MFLPVPQVPEPVRKLRETHRKNSHQFRSKSEGFCTSYDQKTNFTIFFVILNFNFSALTVWFFNFWPQIRILRVEILLGHISACLKTSILKFRLLWIYSYFSLKILSDVFYCFCLLFWSRSCLKSSGRLLGTISTKFRANPTTGVQVITICQLKIWRSCTPPYDLIVRFWVQFFSRNWQN